MVASAIGRSPNPSPVHSDDEMLEAGLRENISRQIKPLADRLKNRWVILLLFVLAVTPFGLSYMNAYQDYTKLRTSISGQQAVLDLPEPRTDDIERGLQSWSAARESAVEEQNLELQDSILVEKLLEAAAIAEIEIQSMSTSANTIVPVGTEAYDATPFLLRISGEFAAIESFLFLLEGDAVEALEIQNSLVAPQDGDTLSGVIRAIVFNRPVDPSQLDDDEREALSRRVTDAELDAAAAGARGAR